MEGSSGPPFSFAHLKGATLPGHRVGPFRSSALLTNIPRRNSDGELSDTKLCRDKYFKCDSRVWISSRPDGASYRSEGPSGESGIIISDPREPPPSWESPDFAPQFSSRPTITPLAAPVSPRPQARRSFNTFPRPWKARSRSPSPFRLKDQCTKSSESFHFKSFSDSLKNLKYSIGGKRDDVDGRISPKYAIQSLNNNDNKTNAEETLSLPSYKKLSFTVQKEINDSESELEGIFKNFQHNSLGSSNKISNSNCTKKHCDETVNENIAAIDVTNSIMSDVIYTEDSKSEAQQVVQNEKEEKSSEFIFKYTCEEGGDKFPSPAYPHATKFSYSGSSLPSVPDKLGSAPLLCDGENCALLSVPKNTFSQSVSNNTDIVSKSLFCNTQTQRVVDNLKYSRFEKQRVSSGGSGPGDREAPLTVCSTQSLMQASGKKIVRKKPQIPDQLSIRRSREDGDQNNEYKLTLSPTSLCSSHSFSLGTPHSRLVKEKSLPLLPTSTVHEIAPIRQETEYKTECNKNRTTVSQILSTLSFARFRLEELTGALGGNKKEGGKGPAISGRGGPARPPRTRHDLEKLKKHTEKLRNSDKKGTTEPPLKQSTDNSNSKGKFKGKVEGSMSKQSVVRANSSPASPGDSCVETAKIEVRSKLSLQETLPTEASTGLSSSNLLLPPLPSLKTRSVQTRDIPFRSASISQGELSFEKRSGKVSPNLKLYTACRNNWGHHSLPRCLPTSPNSESLEKGHKKLSLTSSFNEFDNYKINCNEAQEQHMPKSKSEFYLCAEDNKDSSVTHFSSSLNQFSTTVQCSSQMEMEDAKCNENTNKGLLIDKLLTSAINNEDCARNQHYNMPSEKNTLDITLSDTNLTSTSKRVMKRSLAVDSRFDERVSDIVFEENEDCAVIKSSKSICVQTDDTHSKDEKFKRKFKSKSVEDKREKFRLRLGQKNLSDEFCSRVSVEKEDYDSGLKCCGSAIARADKLDQSIYHFRKESVVECRIVEMEPRSSQCIVIRSSSFNKSSEGLGVKEKEPRATSECRVVQTRQRLSFEDSEGESIDREGKSLSIPLHSGGERASIVEHFTRFSNDSPSDSSSQDSVSTNFHKNKNIQHPFTSAEATQHKEKIERNGSRRRKKGSEESIERVLKREKSHGENASQSKSTKVIRRQENLKKFNRNFQKANAKSYLSDGESRPNSYSEPESLQLVATFSQKISKSERKKKNRSDPGLKKNKLEEAVDYFSDSNMENFEPKKTHKHNTNSKTRSTTFHHEVVSQTSTDSEGKDEFGSDKRNSHDMFMFSKSQTAKHFNPPVILSGQESDTSCQDVSCLPEYTLVRNISRNTSPSPYLGDSDSGERCGHRSPHGPRRYSKRPLRGPYGEMLEAEMSKSKSNSQFLTEDIFLRPRDSTSTSPRPSSPISSLVMPARDHEHIDISPTIFIANENGTTRPSSNPIPASRSLDDSALRAFYSSTINKSETHLTPMTALPYSSYESDSEGGHTLLPSGPMHQRTASSPSKLFFEPGCTSEEDRELLAYFATSKPEETSTSQSFSIENQTVATEHKDISASTKLKYSKTKQDRHLKSPKSKKPPEEDLRTLQQKKGVFETEFRSLADHRHLHRRHRDTRAHIIGEIYDTEKNYVDNLSFLLTRYEQPLRSAESSSIIESSLVDDIFFQVPEIHNHHHRLLDELKLRLDSKDANMCIGDVLLQMLKDSTVAESYLSFINNWKTAQEAAKAAAQAKPAFRHFLVAMAKEHPGKLDLKALLITPVQRFPHYELILKRLLEHTSIEHADHSLVKEAISEVQKVAASINDIEQEALQQEQQQFILKEIENFIEGLVGLVQPDRTFLQLDLVTQNSGLGIRKERCLFLFSDILVITAIKRRSATIRKSSSLQLPLLSSLESCKLKLFKFISLDDLEIGRSRDDSLKKLVKELESLEQDLQTLSQISRLVKTLHFPKGSLEDSLHDLDASLKKQLIDRQGADSQLSELELNITTHEGIESLCFMFGSSEKRNKWEEEFNTAKQKLAMSADRRPPPGFVTALPIRKTRAGLQFTCAAPTLGLNAHNLKDVWVCNSDGYVGQVCVMSLQPEPTLACCNGVCNAKILSIASIPAAPHPDSSDEDEDEELSLEEDLRKRRSESLPPDIGTDENDSLLPTMWLGTEDGSIHVYNCNDTIRTKKNKLKFQPGSSVHCIIHIENRVFASLANGEVVVYDRDAQGSWNCGERHIINLSTAAAPVTRMVMAAGKMWCSAMSVVKILNISSLQIEHSFTVGGENCKGVACMVCAGHGVWIAMHQSAVIRLHHATTHEYICEVSITPAVTKMLAGCDDIIRQHKLACLKVTALLACKDLLWIGTSAGVIITLPLPHLSHNTRRLQSPLNMVAIPHGHTGNVRFLTCVEMTPETRPSRLKSHSRYSFKGKDHQHHQAGTAAPSKLLVISGGDGYEDFRNSGISELAGRDDSTNHLLLWQV